MSTPQTPLMSSPFLERVDRHICAGYQSLVVNTAEIRRVEDELVSLPACADYEAVLTWDCVDGMRVRAVNKKCSKKMQDMLGKTLTLSAQVNDGGSMRTVTTPLNSALGALKYVLNRDDFPFNNCVVIFRNLHIPLGTDVNVAQIWQTAVSARQFNTTDLVPIEHVGSRKAPAEPETERRARCRVPIIIGTGVRFSEAIQPTVTKLEYELPDLSRMRAQFQEIDNLARAQSAELAIELPAADSPECTALAEAAARLLLGLSAVEASDALSLCAVAHGSLCEPAILDTIEHQKAEILSNTASLKYVKRSKLGSEHDIGGFDDYIPWVKMRRHCYTKAGMEEGLDLPKGLVLLGPPGTGKSLVARITARILSLPLVVLDVGAIFGSLVGQSEERMASALRTIEAMQGAVVLVDEADKLWGGANDASGDSGVTRRVFGKFLSWLADKTDGSFVIMTMNRTAGLPPEFLRRGRFDEIFYTDLPELKEREAILRIHLQRRGLAPDTVLPTQTDWDEALDVLKNFVGAEIESAVVQARLVAWDREEGRHPTKDDLIAAASKLVPLMQLDGENIEAIRAFCKEKARPVCKPQQSTPAQPIVGQRAINARRRSAPKDSQN
jgi:hypothetical protein